MNRRLSTLILILLSAAAVAQTSQTGAMLGLPNHFASTNAFDLGIQVGSITFSQLAGLSTTYPTGTNFIYVSDATLGSTPCAGGGTGAFAEFINGAWNCAGGSGGGGGGVTGTGTTTRVAVWTSSTSIGSPSPFVATAAQIQMGTLSALQSIQILGAPTGSCAGTGVVPLPTVTCAGIFLDFNSASASTTQSTAAIEALARGSTAAQTLQMGLYASSRNNAALTESRGVYAEAVDVIAATTTTRRGLFAVADNATGNTTATNEAIVAQTIESSSTNTNDYTFHGLSPSITAGSMTHHYGLYLEDQATGGANNADPWAIFTAGTAKSQLGGALTVVGQFNASAGVLLSTLAGSGSRCVHTDASGNLSATSADCGSPTNIPLSSLATQAADTVVMNASGSSASPTAVSLAALGGTNSCAGASNALTYNSTTHAWGCNTIAGSGTINSGTTNHVAIYTAATTLSSDSALDDGATTASTLTYTASGGFIASGGPVQSSSDGVHAGRASLVGNTTAPALPSNTFTLLGPNSAAFTAFAWQPPTAENGSAGLVHVAAASAHISALTVSAVALTDLATQSADTVVANATGGSASPTAVSIGSCSTAASALTYNTTTHAFGCNTISGSGTVNGGTQGQVAYYATTTTAVSGAGPGTAKQLILSNGTSGPQFADFPEHLIIPAANCNSATAGAGWSIPATNAPTVACRAGTNNLGGVLQWANNNTTTNAQFTFQLPFDWDTGTQPYWNIVYGSGANTSGTVKWTLSTACTKSDGSVSDDPAFNAESTSTGKTMAVANRMWSENAQFATLTSGNNCIAGSTVIVKIVSGNGTAASTVNVAQMTVTVPRLVTVQAD